MAFIKVKTDLGVAFIRLEAIEAVEYYKRDEVVFVRTPNGDFRLDTRYGENVIRQLQSDDRTNGFMDDLVLSFFEVAPLKAIAPASNDPDPDAYFAEQERQHHATLDAIEAEREEQAWFDENYDSYEENYDSYEGE